MVCAVMSLTSFNKSRPHLLFTICTCQNRLAEHIIVILNFKRFMYLRSNTREYDFTIANIVSNSQQLPAYSLMQGKINKIRLVQIRAPLGLNIHLIQSNLLLPLIIINPSSLFCTVLCFAEINVQAQK